MEILKSSKWISVCKIEIDEIPIVLFGISKPYISCTKHLCLGVYLNNSLYSLAIYIPKYSKI